ncbi:MAG TPA: NADH-quinone oxidoreductase subunit H, partial [Flexilinea sp.]|nr:NADH-quinone oxidoreductase subunit H [Flexilinea sp.]
MAALLYEWADRKLVARFQNRVGPRVFQPVADMFKLLVKEEVIPKSVNRSLFIVLPIISFACVMTASLYVPMFGVEAPIGLHGDLIITMYLLSVMTMCLGMAGANSMNRFAVVGATRTFTQLFAYEAPFMLALLMPAISAQSWNINVISEYASAHTWMIATIPIGFIISVIGLMGKLELAPFDAPEAESEIVSGALSEYSGRGLALFRIAKDVEFVIGISLIVTFYLGGFGNLLSFLLRSLGLLVIIALLQSSMTRLRIDQTVGFWWQAGAILS